jgi:hypothetical protein
MVLAIEADGAAYRKSGSVRDRERLRGEHLKRLGWSYHRLWSTNWFRNPQAEAARIRAAYQHAVATADTGQPGHPAGTAGPGRPPRDTRSAEPGRSVVLRS